MKTTIVDKLYETGHSDVWTYVYFYKIFGPILYRVTKKK
jgi:hypothetical protein